MGRGNACTHGKYEGLYYVDYDNFRYSVLDEDDNETEAEEFDEDYCLESVEMFKLKLAKLTTFKPCDRWIARDVHVIMENNLFEIAIEDNEWSYVVKLLQKDDSYEYEKLNLQKKHYENYLSIIRDVLFEQFEQLGIYGGAWTSGTIDRPENFVERR